MSHVAQIESRILATANTKRKSVVKFERLQRAARHTCRRNNQVDFYVDSGVRHEIWLKLHAVNEIEHTIIKASLCPNYVFVQLPKCILQFERSNFQKMFRRSYMTTFQSRTMLKVTNKNM